MNENLDLPVIYTNRIKIETNTHDISIIVGNKFRTEPVENYRIVMSWSHAKMLQKILNQQLEIHEELFGEIVNEPNKEALEKLVAEGKVNMQPME